MDEEQVHHDGVTGQKSEWLKCVLPAERGNRDQRWNARSPEEAPPEARFVLRSVPHVHERGGCTDESSELRHQDPEYRAIESPPEPDTNYGASERPAVDFRPSRLPILQRKQEDETRTSERSYDLSAHRLLGVHPRQREAIETHPDEPRSFHRLRLVLHNGCNVGDESDEEDDAGELRKVPAHELVLLWTLVGVGRLNSLCSIIYLNKDYVKLAWA